MTHQEEDEADHVVIGAEFHLEPDAAEAFRAHFREVLGELVDEYEADIIDYGMD